ncbi:MAG: response regulator [Deltaproteobacteria bacterium]|nr:response regulator [Deltaproteobacteria bacterium]
MKVLIVEDDVASSSSISDAVASWGYRTESAETGELALKKIENESFDLVLLDIFLPDCKGHELISQFKTKQPDIGVITMTGYNSRDLEKEVRKQGILFYMIKPFADNHLRNILDHIDKKKMNM